MKACRKSSGITPLILNLGIRSRTVIYFTPQSLYPWQRAPTPIKFWVGTRAGLDVLEKRKNILPPPEYFFYFLFCGPSPSVALLSLSLLVSLSALYNTHNTNAHALSEIRNRNPSNRVPFDRSATAIGGIRPRSIVTIPTTP